MNKETGIGSGILLVALIVGILCFYLGKAVGGHQAYESGYKDGYSQAYEEME